MSTSPGSPAKHTETESANEQTVNTIQVVEDFGREESLDDFLASLKDSRVELDEISGTVTAVDTIIETNDLAFEDEDNRNSIEDFCSDLRDSTSLFEFVPFTEGSTPINSEPVYDPLIVANIVEELIGVAPSEIRLRSKK